MSVAVSSLLGDGLAVSHLWGSHLNLNLVSPLQDVDLNIKVKLTHSLKNSLTGIEISLNAEGRILLNHLTKCHTKLLGIRLVLWSDRKGDHGIREDHWLKSGWIILGAKSVSGLNILQPHKSNDVTRLGAIELGAVISVHLDETAHTLGFTRESVQNGVTLLHGSRVDTGESQSTELIVHDLEGKGTERTICINSGELAGQLTLVIKLRLGIHL